MQVTSAMFDVPYGGTNPAWALRVLVEGIGFEHRAMPLAATIGNVQVEAIVGNLAGTAFIGLLATMPPAGATLRVGYRGEPLVDTGITLPQVVV